MRQGSKPVYESHSKFKITDGHLHNEYKEPFKEPFERLQGWFANLWLKLINNK
jgi:hypothetical protein